jgi:predicted RNA binding protein YcfA (HicA-like mRNA interferase family)
MNGKQIIKILKSEGWEIIRISGSHHRMAKGNKRTTVPVHGSRDLDAKTFRTIENQTGVKLK